MSTELDIDERAWLEAACDRTNRDLVVLDSPWWGNEKFGEWRQTWFCEVGHETEKAYKLNRVVSPRAFVREVEVTVMTSDEPEDVADTPPGEVEGFAGFMADHRRLVTGGFEDRKRLGWVPKSAVSELYRGSGTLNVRVFDEDGDLTDEQTRPGDVDVLIREPCTVPGGYSRYKKLAVDADPECSDDLKSLDWDDLKCSGHGTDDEFLCWTVDRKPQLFAKRMIEQGWKVGVHPDAYE